MPLVSIIVPVYKAEAYLKRCVDSIIAQTFRDWELLLIDDGSPDNSGELCDNYSKQNSRIKTFHKQNGGVSSARQFGLEHAIGEYVIHADPDDWVEPDMLMELYKKAKSDDVDMVICDYYSETGTEQKYDKQQPVSLEPDDIFKALFSDLHGATWNKLIRLSTIRKYNIRFPQGLNLCEDLYFIAELCLHPIKIAYLPKAFYHYDLCINQNSMARKPSRKTIDSFMRFIEHFQPLWNERGMSGTAMKYKIIIKEFAFVSQLYTARDLKNFYTEVNQEYKRRAYKSWYSEPGYMQILLAMNGHRMLGGIYNRLIFGIRHLIPTRQ